MAAREALARQQRQAAAAAAAVKAVELSVASAGFGGKADQPAAEEGKAQSAASAMQPSAYGNELVGAKLPAQVIASASAAAAAAAAAAATEVEAAPTGADSGFSLGDAVSSSLPQGQPDGSPPYRRSPPQRSRTDKEGRTAALGISDPADHQKASQLPSNHPGLNPHPLRQIETDLVHRSQAALAQALQQTRQAVETDASGVVCQEVVLKQLQVMSACFDQLRQEVRFMPCIALRLGLGPNRGFH